MDTDDRQGKGRLIVLEGIDGSGKTTQARLLGEKLRAHGVPCYETKEPTEGPIGALLRQFMSGRMRGDERVIAALFAADRLDHLLNDTDGLLAKINAGVTVVSDRYYMSSYAYHGVCMPMSWVIAANEQSAGLLRPDCNVFVDVSPETALHRMQRARFHTQLYETRARLAAVRGAYFEAFEKLAGDERVAVVDGEAGVETVAARIWEHVSYYFQVKS